MRHRTGISGGTLIYGPQADPPDLLLASQFLIDDLRQDGRTISGVRINRHALRLRADGFDLALSLSDAPLPMHAFSGTARPLPEGADLARGRVMHALRHHRWVLGLLMRLRGVQEGQSMDERLLALPVECRSLIATVAEAAPPALVIWQANGVVCTGSEFLRLPAAMLDGPSSALEPLGLAGARRGPRARPAPVGRDGDGHARVTPSRAIPALKGAAAAATAAPGPANSASDAFADALVGRGEPATLPAILSPSAATHVTANEAPARQGKAPPDSRAARAGRQSVGRLFGGKTQTRRLRMAGTAGLSRQDDRLARALRIDTSPAAQAAAGTGTAAQSRAGAGLRIAIMCMALAFIGPSAGGPDPTSRVAENWISGVVSGILALPTR